MEVATVLLSYSEIEEDKLFSTCLTLSLRDFNVQTRWCCPLELLASPGVEAAICDSFKYAVIFFFCQTIREESDLNSEKVFLMAFPPDVCDPAQRKSSLTLHGSHPVLFAEFKT